MRCPKCRTETLDPFGVIEGVHVDFCSECKGIWFDEGELAFYTEMPDDVPDLEKALRHGRSTDQTCPRCGDQQLVELSYLPGRPPVLDLCPKCRGVFVDKGELPQVEQLSTQARAPGVLRQLAVHLKKSGSQIDAIRATKSK